MPSAIRMLCAAVIAIFACQWEWKKVRSTLASAMRRCLVERDDLQELAFAMRSIGS